jgi:hypothetical protein
MTNIKNIIDNWTLNQKGLVWRATDETVYVDNPSTKFENLTFDTPVLDARAWNEQSSSSNNPSDKSAAIVTSSSDPLALTDVFPDEFGELANDWLSDIQSARKTKDRSKAAAIITSQDYSILQDAVVIGESMSVTKTGALTQAIPEIAMPNLKGEWITWADTVEYHLNVPEGQAVEPSKGTASAVTYTIKKGMGGVAITEYAQAMIREANPFSRLIQEMQNQRLYKENAMVADEIENATSVIAGIDFGLRAGAPALSSNSPEALWLTIQDAFDAVGGTLNMIMSKNQAYNEYKNNDFVRGFYLPLGATSINESSGPAPGLPGVTWVRDNAIVSATKLWAMDITKAIKGFRAGVRSFQLTNPKFENTEYYTKSFYTPKIVDNNFIKEVTGVTA